VRLRELGSGQVTIRGGRVVVGPVSLTSHQLRALRERHARAMYDSREGSVSIPASSAPAERIAIADELLAGLAAVTSVA
jgi:hypothetical protein